MKNIKNMNRVLVMLLCVVLVGSNVWASSVSESEVMSDEDILEEGLSFILSTMSDFSDEDNYNDNLISKDSLEFKKFLENKRDIARIKQEFAGTWTEKSNEVTDLKLKKLYNDIYEVTADISHEFYSGEDESFIDSKYKIIVRVKSDSIEVISGMSNDLSSGTLFPENITKSSEELAVINWEDTLIGRLNFKLQNDVKTLDYAKYDFEDIKDNLLQWYEDEMNIEDNSNEYEDFDLASDQELDEASPRALKWNFFTASEKSKMTQYQKKHYNNYNKNYADFSSVGGDCTNYASQILRSGGSAFNPSSSSGIMGDSYWYYRNSSNRSTSWTASKNLKNFLLRSASTLGPKARTVSKYGDLDVGSIVFLTRNGQPYHSVIVAERGGDPMVSAHTANYYGRYSNRYSGISHIKAHVRGYYN